MQQIRHILWDWNGTLIDDAWLCVEILNDMLKRRDMSPVSPEIYQAAFTFPVIELYRNVGFSFTHESFETVAAEFITAYDARVRECRLQPAARLVLETLAARGLRQSILSAYEQNRLDGMVAHLGLSSLFAHLVGQRDYYSTGKVAEGRRLLAELDTPPDRIVLIGDSLHDAEVAETMGIRCLLIPSGHYARHRLLASGATVLDTLPEVLTHQFAA